MSNKFVIAEEGHVSFGSYPVSANGLTTLDAINMENYSHLSVIIALGATNGSALVATAYAATDAAATSAEVIAFNYYQETTASTDVLGARTLNSTTALTFGNDSISNTFAVIEIDASELPADHKFVNITLNGATTTTPVCVVYVQSGARYGGPESPTVLS
jgi:hypothetical protein